MKCWSLALFVLLAVFVTHVNAQNKQFGEAPQRQLAANYKGEWKVVVGAKGIKPIVSMNGGTTKTISASSVLSFPRKDKVLPIAGKIQLTDKVVKTPYHWPDDNVKTVTLKFVPQQDFDNLYIGLFLWTKEPRLIGIRVKEVGKVTAGKSYNVDYEYIEKDHEKPPEVRFYSKGLELSVSR